MNLRKYTALFLEETRENCATLNQLLVTLERTPQDAELLTQIMRLCHSCKGAAATVNYPKTAEFCHSLEEIFDRARKGTLAITSAVIDVCLKAVDSIEACLKEIEQGKPEYSNFPPARELASLAQSEQPASAPQPQPGNGSSAAAAEPEATARVPHIRVESKKLDALLDLCGELSVLRLQFSTLNALRGPQLAERLRPLTERFSRLLSELTYEINESRLIPLDQVFVRFPRMVRDLAREQGKNINFSMTGTGIELDKTLVDQLTTPLIHLLRNAVDHGIETPAVRKQKGKPEQGEIAIDVQRQQGYAVITVEDDGEEISVANIRTLAKEHGFTAAELEGIREETLIDTLASARLSSTKDISMISGRGVGLSAVRSTVIVLGGRLELTQHGGHKQFRLALPLQISVIRAILVRAKDQTYAFPFIHIQSLLNIQPSDIQMTLSRPAIALNGQDIPLFSLQEVFFGEHIAWREQASPLPILLIEQASGTVGIHVDEVLHNEEITVKPVSASIRQVQYFSGSTILGNGQVALIIDTPALIEHYAHSLARN